jgi:hypothetical protein
MGDDDGWKVGLDDLSADEEEEGKTDGWTDPAEIPVEPERWTLEGAAFVVLGVAATLFVFLRFAVG